MEGKSVVEALAYKPQKMIYGYGCGGCIKNELDLTVVLHLDSDISKRTSLKLARFKIGAVLLSLHLKGSPLGLYGYPVIGKHGGYLEGEIGAVRGECDRGEPSVLGKLDHYVLVKYIVHRDRGTGVLVRHGAVLKALIAILEGEIHYVIGQASLRDAVLIISAAVCKEVLVAVRLIEHRAVICILGDGHCNVIKNERCLPYLLGNGGVFSCLLAGALPRALPRALALSLSVTVATGGEKQDGKKQGKCKK